jgi:hypothetical protein
VWVFVLYVGFLALIRPGLVSIFGFLVYAQFALFWMAYAYAYGEIDVSKVTRTNLAIAAVVAIIGIYQYLFNRTLWGFSSYGGVGEYFELGAALRVNSVMPSAMTLGAYLVFAAVLGLTERGGGWRKAAIGLCIACAFLTGNKSTLLSLGAVVVYTAADRGMHKYGVWGLVRAGVGVLAGYAVLLITVATWGPWLAELNPTLYRVIAPFFFAGDLSGVTFLVAYWATLFIFYGGSGFGSILLGNGVGLTRQDTTFFGGGALGDFPVAESYFVQLLFEIGLVGFLLFHVILWRVFRRARAARPPAKFGIDHMLVALYANMIVVHVFSGVFVGFLWGYFVSLLMQRRPSEAPVRDAGATVVPVT